MLDGTTVFANAFGSIAVSAPDHAHAVVGSAPVIDRPLAKRLHVDFGDRTASTIPGARIDTGEEYTPARGYGWVGPISGGPAPIAMLDDHGTMKPIMNGRHWERVGDAPRAGLATGWSDHVETWHADVPNGRYRVTVRVGDALWAQGPHHVRVQGVQVVDRLQTAQGEFAERSAIVSVNDGRLTMEVGGGGAGAVSPDGSSDTTIASLELQPID